MNISIKNPLVKSPRARQWLWFAALWCGGLAAALTLGGIIKLFFWMIGGTS